MQTVCNRYSLALRTSLACTAAKRSIVGTHRKFGTSDELPSVNWILETNFGASAGAERRGPGGEICSRGSTPFLNTSLTRHSSRPSSQTAGKSPSKLPFTTVTRLRLLRIMKTTIRTKPAPVRQRIDDKPAIRPLPAIHRLRILPRRFHPQRAERSIFRPHAGNRHAAASIQRLTQRKLIPQLLPAALAVLDRRIVVISAFLTLTHLHRAPPP